MADFDILFGADLSLAESKIESFVNSIQKKYTLEVEATLDSTKFFTEYDKVKDAIDKLKALDININVKTNNIDGSAKNMKELATNIEKGAKELDNVGKKVGDKLSESMTKAKNEAKETNDEISEGNRLLQTRIKHLKDAEGNDKKVKTETTGNDTKKKIQTFENDVPLEQYEEVVNHEKARTNEIKLQRQLEEQKIKLETKGLELERAGLGNKKSITKFQRMVSELDKESINNLEKLAKKLHEIEMQYQLINKQASYRKFLDTRNDKADNLDKKAKKLDTSTLPDDDVVRMKADIIAIKKTQSIDEMTKALKRANDTYDELIEKQKLVEKMASGREKSVVSTGTENAKVDQKQTDAINKEVERVGLNQLELNKYTKEYNEILQKLTSTGFINESDLVNVKNLMNGINAESVEFKNEIKDIQKEIKQLESLSDSRMKAQDKLVQDMASGREKSNAKTNAEVSTSSQKQHEAINKEVERVGMNQIELNKYTKEYNDILRTLSSTGFINDNDLERVNQLMSKITSESVNFKNEIKEIQNEVKQLESLAESRLKEQSKLVQDMASGREKSQSKTKNDSEKIEQGQHDAINKEVERVGQNQLKLNEYTKEFNQTLSEIIAKGFIKDHELIPVKNILSSITAESTKFSEELGKVSKELKEIQTLQNSRTRSQANVDGMRSDWGHGLDELEARGNVPEALIRNFRQLSETLDFSSGVEEIKEVKREFTNLLKLERDIISAYKEDRNIQESIERVKQNAVSFSDKQLDSIRKIKENVTGQLKDEQAIENINNQIENAVRNINNLKERGTDISYEESRAIKEQLDNVKRLVDQQKTLEAQLEREKRIREQLASQTASVTYRAGRGLDNNPFERAEVNSMSDNLRGMLDGLNHVSGEDFEREVDRIRQSMDSLNRRSTQLRNQIRDDSNSVMGQLRNAMGKVPIWLGASTLFFESMNQIGQGFTYLLDFDKAMTNLGKVTEASNEQLEEFENTAHSLGQQLGVLSTDIVNSTAEFQKLGYTLQEATVLGKSTILYANVGDMDVETAQENIVSTIKGFGIEVDASGRKVQEVVDMFNEVSNNYAISAQGIGEALKRSSAVLHEGGNSIQQAVALVTAANTTIQDPKKVGNAMKTISMRLRGLTEEGEYATELIPELEGMLVGLNEKLGLTGKDELTLLVDEDTFKTTYEIFDQLSEHWESFTDLEQANLVEAIGGKEQGSIVASMIQNWADATGSYESALDSAGSAQREFVNYMDSFEYKIGRLKNSMEAFWLTLVNDEAVKSFIDTLNSMVQGMTTLLSSDMVGGTTLIAEIVALFALFGSKNLRTVITNGGRTADIIKAVGGAVGGLWKGLKMFGRLIPVIGGVMTAVWGLTKAVEVVWKWWNRDDIAREERISKLEDEITEVNSLKEAYQKLDESYSDDEGRVKGIDRYAELDKKGNNRTDEEEVEYQDMTETIAENMPEAIQYFDEFGNAILKSADELVRLRDEIDKTSLELETKLHKENIEEMDFSDLQESVDEIKRLYEQSGMLNNEVDLYSIAEQYLENEISKLEEGTPEYEAKVLEMQEKMRDYFNSDENEMNLTAFEYGAMQSNLNQMLNNGEVAQAIAYMQAMKKQIADQSSGMVKEIQNAEDLINTEMDDFKMMVSEGFSLALRNMGESANSNTGLLAKQLEKYVVDNIAQFDAETVEEIVADIPNILQTAINSIETQGVTVDDIFRIDGVNASQTVNAIDKVIASLEKEGSSAHGLINILKLLKNEHLNTANTMNNAEIRPFNYIQDVQPLVETFTGTIDGLDSSYRTLSEGQALSQTQIMDLIARYPQLTKEVESHNGTLKLSGKAIKELAKTKEEEFKADLQIKKQQALNAQEKAKSAIKSIGAEIEALGLLEKANRKSVQSNLTAMTKMQTNFKKVTLPASMGGQALQEQMDKGMQKQIDQYQAYIDALDSYESLSGELNAINALLNTSFTSNLGNIQSVAKETKKAKDKEKKSISDAIYVWNKYADTIHDVTELIERQQALQERYFDGGNAYRWSITEEIKLHQRNSKAIKDEIASLEKQIKAKRIQQYGVVAVGEKDDNSTQRKKNAELTQEIQEAKDRLSELYTETYSNLNDIIDLRWKLIESQNVFYETLRDNVTDDIAYHEYAMKLYDDRSQSFRNHAKEAQKYYEEQQRYNRNELDYLIKQKTTNKDLTESQINDLNKLIRARREAIYDLSETIIDLETQIAQSDVSKHLAYMANESNKYAKHVEEINKKLKYDINEGDYAKEIAYNQQILAYKKGEVVEAESNIKKLKQLKEQYKDNLEVTAELSKEIESWEESLSDTQYELLDLGLEIEKIYKEIADNYVEIYKDQLELMKKADEEYYDNKLEEEAKAHEGRMKQIDKEMEALQDAYDQQNRLLDRESSTRTYENQLTSLRKETQELKEQIDVLSLDDSYEAKSKKSELVKQLAEKELELAELNYDREFELRKNNLEEDLEADMEELQSRKDTLEESYNKWKETEEKKKEERMKYWEEELSNERKFAQMRQDVLNGSLEEMLGNLETWSGQVEGEMASLGENITNNFTDKVQEAIDALTEMKNMNLSSLAKSIDSVKGIKLFADEVVTNQLNEADKVAKNYSAVKTNPASKPKTTTTTKPTTTTTTKPTTTTTKKSDTTTTVTFSTGNANRDKIWNFFKSKGFTDNVVAGIMGNLQMESNFSPTAKNPSSGAYGIAQWLGSRKTDLTKYASSVGSSISDLTTQLNFLWKELNSTEKKTMNWLNTNKTASSSTVAKMFDKLFERSEGTTVAKRQSYASSILSTYKGKTTTPTTTTKPSTSSSSSSSSKRYHTVKSGDTMADLAKKYYGSSYPNWTKIRDANPNVNPNKMKVGQKLLIPFRSGGYTGDWSGDNGRLAVLHKKELVLNKEQTSDILQSAKLMEKIKGALPTLNTSLNNIGHKEETNNVTHTNEYHISVNVARMTGDKSDAEIVAEQIKNSLKRSKGGRY